MCACNSIVGYHIATNFCTRHDNTAVVLFAKCNSNHFTTTWTKAKWNFHRIRITKTKSLGKGPLTYMYANGLMLGYPALNDISTTHRGRVTHVWNSALGRHWCKNGLWAVRLQTIIWTHAGTLSIAPHGDIFQWDLNPKSFTHSLIMSANASQPQSDKPVAIA